MQTVISWFRGNFATGDVKRYGDDTTPEKYLKLQVDNHLRLEYDAKDLLIVTNFPFAHNGIKSYVVNTFNQSSAFGNKLPAVKWLMENGIAVDDLFLHDCDVYTLIYHEFPKECRDVGMVKHSHYKSKLQGGVTYVRKQGYDIILKLSDFILDNQVRKEESMLRGWYDKPEYKDRFTLLNYRYNMFRQREFAVKYAHTIMPIINCHLHAEYQSCWDCFVEGKNKYSMPIITPEIKELMEKYAIRPTIQR